MAQPAARQRALQQLDTLGRFWELMESHGWRHRVRTWLCSL